MKQMSTLKFPNQTEAYEIVDAAARLEVAGKSDISHTHTRSEITDFAHEHDERYYTEVEIDTKISELDTSLKGYTDGKIASIPTVDSYTKAEVDSALAGKADTDHNHDSTYETKEDAQIKYDTITEAKADWNQNDAAAIDYIKNRTHWVESSSLVVMEETSVTVHENKRNFYAATNQITADGSYIATIDGTKYNGIFKPAYSDSEYIYFELSGAPIRDFIYDINNNAFLFSPVINGTYTVKIEGVVCECHPLDENFIPDTIARQSYVDSNFALKSDLDDIDLSGYETTANAQLKYDSILAITTAEIETLCAQFNM